MVSAEYGQLNSIYNDSRLGITQGIAFPTVYTRQKQLLEAEAQQSQLQAAAQALEVKRQVSSLFYELRFLLEKQRLLQQADTLYAAFLERQEQRFRLGDANVLERTAAQAQRQQIANQLRQLALDLQVVQVQFSRVLNSPERYLPVPGPLLLPAPPLPDTAQLAVHPFLRWQTQQRTIAERQWRLERARMLPQLELGYFNQSFQGFQLVNGTERFFPASSRFHSGLVGLSLPLFYQSGRARISASKLNRQLTERELADTRQQLTAQLQQALLQHRKNEQALTYFRESALPQARTLTEQAELLFVNGEINYLEWILLVNQSIGLQSDYLNAVKDWNQTVLELRSYAGEL